MCVFGEIHTSVYLGKYTHQSPVCFCFVFCETKLNLLADEILFILFIISKSLACGRGSVLRLWSTDCQCLWSQNSWRPGPRNLLSYHELHFIPVCTTLSSIVVQQLSHVCFFVTPWTATRQASLSFTVSQSLLKLMSIESMMPSSHLILCHPLLLLPSVLPSLFQCIGS